MKKNENNALLPAGFRDVLPPDAAFEEQIANRLVDFFSLRGYNRIKPPLMEFEEGLLSGTGIALAPQTFRLMDPISQRMMGIRADITPQIARVALSRLRTWPRPLRLSYAGEVLRVRGSQLLPGRQLYQVGAEIIGSDNQTLMEEYISIIRKFNLENLDLLEIYYDSQINGNNKRFDSVNDAINNLIKRKYLYSLNFATTNADYEISPFIVTTEIPDANKELLKQVYDKFNDSIRYSKYGKLLMEIIGD